MDACSVNEQAVVRPTNGLDAKRGGVALVTELALLQLD